MSVSKLEVEQAFLKFMSEHPSTPSEAVATDFAKALIAGLGEISSGFVTLRSALHETQATP